MKSRLLVFLLALGALANTAKSADALAQSFVSPPPSARPWVFWFWINGNISKEGITADLEAMKRVGIGGMIWMEVSGPWWAPEGKVRALSPEWQDCMQWAIRECDRLGLEFDLSVDFGYGSGGPHITPENSMQKLYWSETPVDGGQKVAVVLPRPKVEKNLSAWLRPGAEISGRVREMIEKSDSYRDIAVLAMPAPVAGGADRMSDLSSKDGTNSRPPQPPRKGKRVAASRPPAVIPADRVIDVTDRMQPDGRLTWEAPAGKWLILRLGHASNFKMTRPSPAAAVGLECDRLGTAGIDAHYDAFLKPIFVAAGAAAGRALTHVHVDSWEAGGQNWTATFPTEFKARRGYDLRRWLPVLAGRVVGSSELTERFLWDVRATVNELTLDHYARRLRELGRKHGIRFSTEAYGRLCIDNLAYAGVADLPISEFWAVGDGQFPSIPATRGYWASTKAMASAAHIYGRPVVGAESFTSDRGWRDHPFLLKGMGDERFCRGLNRMIFHLSAHQAYNDMIPGLTHRRWGEHIQRHNTWWDYSGPWLGYLTRCQSLLQQGQLVADVCYWFGEGAPLDVNSMTLDMPKGHDFDFCSSEIVLQASVKDGRIVLPSGANYGYLLLPEQNRMTVTMARKVRELVQAGARVIGGPRLEGAPGLTDYPRCDMEVRAIAAELWDSGRIRTGKTLANVFADDRLAPDFEGGELLYVHRWIAGADVYFVSHQQNRPADVTATFRIKGKRPELWDPETGAIRELPQFMEKDGRTSVPLHFEPMQSWFVVFRSAAPARADAIVRQNFASWREMGQVAGPWQVSFDPKWGGPDRPVTFATLTDWSRNADPRIHYYSGTATYRTAMTITAQQAAGKSLWLDLGAVEVMARVRVNGQDCGIAWKPPYRVDISRVVRAGRNELEVAVVNLWVNRMIGDEQLPLDGNWKDFETLLEWPDWFRNGTSRPSGRYTFTTARHYKKDSPLAPSGLLGPVTLQSVSTGR